VTPVRHAGSILAACLAGALHPALPAQGQVERPRLREAIESIQPLSEAGFEALAEEPEGAWDSFPASDRRFEYWGRIDFADESAPTLIWQGSQVRFRFSGTRLALRLADSRGADYYDVVVDGRIHLLEAEDAADCDYVLEETLGPGEHEAVLFKRNEAMSSRARFKGILLERGCELLERPAPAPLKIEFYGDSITAGACDEIPGDDQYQDMVGHNNYTSYAAIAARALGAEYSNVSYSGTGICASWNEFLMPDCWDLLYPEPDSPAYDFRGRDPDIVVINLGQNDYGYTQSVKQPFPSGFAQEYSRLVREIRERYPEAWIVCATGGMSAVKSSRDLNKALNAALKELSADPRILSMTFRAFTYDHPRVDTHMKMALELEAFIRENVPAPGL
jgi:lysophospholipase L1-like esterase